MLFKTGACCVIAAALLSTAGGSALVAEVSSYTLPDHAAASNGNASIVIPKAIVPPAIHTRTGEIKSRVQNLRQLYVPPA